LNLVVRQDRSVVDAIQLLPVETKSATVERFDMQGRRIENARQARGIYLERRGNTVRKVMKR
nr:hypothetical protein [Prevotella sp.]